MGWGVKAPAHAHSKEDMPTFTPHVVPSRNTGAPAPFDRMFNPSTVTVLKTGASYRALACPSNEEVEAADIAYLGGRTYTISTDEAAALTAAGYAVVS